MTLEQALPDLISAASDAADCMMRTVYLGVYKLSRNYGGLEEGEW